MNQSVGLPMWRRWASTATDVVTLVGLIFGVLALLHEIVAVLSWPLLLGVSVLVAIAGLYGLGPTRRRGGLISETGRALIQDASIPRPRKRGKEEPAAEAEPHGQIGGPTSEQWLEQWLRRAAEVGDPAAMSELGSLLVQKGRAEEAERWLRRAAEVGDPAAISELGSLLVQQDRAEEAERWLRQERRHAEQTVRETAQEVERTSKQMEERSEQPAHGSPFLEELKRKRELLELLKRYRHWREAALGVDPLVERYYLDTMRLELANREQMEELIELLLQKVRERVEETREQAERSEPE